MYIKGLSVIDSNGYNYCVDMVRLKTEISISEFRKKIENRLNFYKENLTRWTSSQIGQFYYNYQFSCERYSFWFGFISNKNCDSLQNLDKVRNLTIEFNPNKCDKDPLIMAILKSSPNWTIKSMDFALDIKENILNIIGFDKQGKSFLTTIDNGLDNRTYYMGVKNNRVKIYNKRIENNLDYDLTRIEITKYLDIDIKDCSKFEFGYFPELFLRDYQLNVTDMQLDNMFATVLFAVEHGYPLHDLSRKYKEKVKNFLQQKKPIKIDFSCFLQCSLNYLSYYFPFLSEHNI